MFHHWCLLNQQTQWLSKHPNMLITMAKFTIPIFMSGPMYVQKQSCFLFFACSITLLKNQCFLYSDPNDGLPVYYRNTTVISHFLH